MPHFIQLNSAEQGSKEWLEARKAGIGSSDAAAAIGVSKWKTPIQLWEEKTKGIIETENNWYMARGKALEPLIRQHYANETGEEVKNMHGVLCHPEHKWMLASLDGYTDSGKLLEIKTATTKHGWGEAGTDQIPGEYLVQVMHAMIVTGIDKADVVVSFGGGIPEKYVVHYDNDVATRIIEREKEFWRLVETQTEPAPMTIEEMQSRYRIIEENYIFATEVLSALYNNLLHWKKMEGVAQSEKVKAEDEIKKELLQSGASTLLSSDGEKLITWKEQKGRKTVDSKRLEKERPDIYEQYLKCGEPFRTFRVY